MNSGNKIKTRGDLLKELDRLTNVFSNLTKEFRERGDIEGLEEDFQKAQEDLTQFWKDYGEFRREGHV